MTTAICISGVRSASGAENGAVHIARDLAADRVAGVVPHNPKVTPVVDVVAVDETATNQITYT